MEPTTSGDTLVPVYYSDSELDAQLYRAMLEGEGIRVTEESRSAYISQAVWPEQHIEYLLLVFTYDAEHAAALIEKYRQQVDSGALALPEDETTDASSPPEGIPSRGALFTVVVLLFCLIVIGLAMLRDASNNILLLIIALFLGLAVIVRLMTMP